MFSLDNFYRILYNNLLEPCDIFGHVLHTEDATVQEVMSKPEHIQTLPMNHVIFYDQEPLSSSSIYKMITNGLFFTVPHSTKKIIFANSEISDFKNTLLNDLNLLDWYFFSHGFIALDWFRDAKYLLIDKTSSFDKVFIMYNNLILKDRSYRLGIVADILKRGLRAQGLISLPLVDHYHGKYLNEVFDTNSKLDKEHKKLILETIHKLPEPLSIDSSRVNGTFSAKLNLYENQRAFWHVVSETNFYHKKLHLTEKVFKPIVSYRPFILCCAPGNLKYLRSYGFKTFGDFIDESYDDEIDDNKRMSMIVDEIEKLCVLTPTQQREMFDAMKPILEHNFNHFYGDFKKIIVDEMVYGFGECVDGTFDDSSIDYAAVAKKLTQ